MAEDIWTVLVCRPIGTPDGLIPQVSSGVPGAELIFQMHQVYPIYVVLLQRHLSATRIVRSYLGGRGEQEVQGATHASQCNHCCTWREPFFCWYNKHLVSCKIVYDHIDMSEPDSLIKLVICYSREL